MFMSLVPLLGSLAGRIAQSIFPTEADKTKRLEAENAIKAALVANRSEIEKAAADIVLAEARGESWLQRNWRPIFMLTLAGMLVLHWMGFTQLIAPDNRLSDSEVDGLLDIVKIGLGGYVVGRSGEKITSILKSGKVGETVSGLPWRDK